MLCITYSIIKGQFLPYHAYMVCEVDAVCDVCGVCDVCDVCDMCDVCEACV